VLFILAEFADVPFDTAGIDTTGRGDPDTSTLLVDYFERQLWYIRQYYDDVSYGRMVFEPFVLDRVVSLPFRMRYYGDDDRFGERGTKLIWDAVAGVDDEIDFGAFTGMVVIHSGAGQESDIDNDSKDQIWSAFFPQPLLSSVLTDSLGYDVPGIPTNDLTAQGDTIYVEGSAIVPETEAQDGFNFGIMGVFTHELGHVTAGWPDLYDTTPDDPSQGLGAFCLMAAGTWNANGFVPGEPSAWCRAYAGWVDPVLVDTAPPEGRVVRVKHIERDALAPDDTVVVRIPISGDEYFLVANRQPDLDDDRFFDWTGPDGEPGEPPFGFWTDSYAGAEFDYFTPNLIPNSPQAIYREAEGLYVWHVDESTVTFGFPFNIVNADPRHQGIDLEEADGVQDMEHTAYTILSFGSPDDAFREGNATELTPRTEPSTHTSFGGVSGVAITEISAADTVMSFRLRFQTGDGGGGEPVVREGWPVTLADVAMHAQPLVVDLGGDTDEEAVVVGASGDVRVFDPSGADVAGSFSIGGAPAGSPLAGDTDGDGIADLVVIAASGGVHRAIGGTGPLGGALAAATDSIGRVEGALVNLDADVSLELVIGSDDAGPDSTDARLWVVDFAGGSATATRHAVPAALSGAPVIASEPSGLVIVHPVGTGGLSPMRLDAGVLTTGTPAVDDVTFWMPSAADLDRDGSDEVIAAGSDGQVYVFDIGPGPSLELRQGWPVQIFATPMSGVSAADVTGDGIQEVLAVGTGGSLHALNYNAVPLQGWPKTLPVPIEVFYDFAPPHPAPLAADVTGDGRLDLVAVFGDGRTMALGMGRGEARPLAGWPVQAGPGAVPVVGDFDGDGLVDLFAIEAAVDGDGEALWTRATMWSLGVPYASRSDAWRMHRRGPERAARVPASADAPSGGDGLLADVYCQPNPAYRDGTSFHYRLGGSADRVEIAVYDVSGQEVRRLGGDAFAGVDNLVRWDGRNDDGERVAPGLYVYRVTATGGSRTDTVVGKLAFVR
jgi:M6 family metalloprotease-like protein